MTTFSHDQIRDLVGIALNADVGPANSAYPDTIFPDSVVYSVSLRSDLGAPGPQYQRSYVVDAAGRVTLGDKPVKVRASTTYTPVSEADRDLMRALGVTRLIERWENPTPAGTRLRNLALGEFQPDLPTRNRRSSELRAQANGLLIEAGRTISAASRARLLAMAAQLVAFANEEDGEDGPPSGKTAATEARRPFAAALQPLREAGVPATAGGRGEAYDTGHDSTTGESRESLLSEPATFRYPRAGEVELRESTRGPLREDDLTASERVDIHVDSWRARHAGVTGHTSQLVRWDGSAWVVLGTNKP